MAVADHWQVWALRLGTAQRPARDNFLAPGDRDGEMALDFTMWVLRNADTVVVLDTGFNAEAGRRRGRSLDRAPAEALTALGIAPHQVSSVVLSHLHYDHAGNIDDFPDAQLVVQAEEMRYVTGASMAHSRLNHFFEVDDITGVVRALHAGRLRVVDGDVELAPGLEAHLIGGHTQGLQVLRVRTERGWVVLAADALHYYENFHDRNPFPAILDLGRMLDGYERLAELAETEDHIIPGHDPAVFARYPAIGSPDAVALHCAPAPVD